MGNPVTVIDPAEITRLAAQHGVAAGQITTWANEDGNFPMEYLRTHGVINYGTFLELMAFYIARRAAGESFATANSQTQANLTAVNIDYANTEAANAEAATRAVR